MICSIVNLFLLVLFLRALISWIPSRGGVVGQLESALAVVTEPVLAPVRRRVPPIRLGAGGVDTAFLVVLLLLTRVVGTVVCGLDL